jgi:hypothetical protein
MVFFETLKIIGGIAGRSRFLRATELENSLSTASSCAGGIAFPALYSEIDPQKSAYSEVIRLPLLPLSLLRFPAELLCFFFFRLTLAATAETSEGAPVLAFDSVPGRSANCSRRCWWPG